MFKAREIGSRIQKVWNKFHRVRFLISTFGQSDKLCACAKLRTLWSWVLLRRPGLPVGMQGLRQRSKEAAVVAMKNGAFDFVMKPFELDELALIVKRALGSRRPKQEHHLPVVHIENELSLAKVTGSSEQMRAVLAATNQELPSLVRTKHFRGDLFHRLNEFRITVPPLRQRREDIVSLAKYFLGATARELTPMSDLNIWAFWVGPTGPTPGNLTPMRSLSGESPSKRSCDRASCRWNGRSSLKYWRERVGTRRRRHASFRSTTRPYTKR